MERLLLKHLQNEEEDYLYSLVWQDLLLNHFVWESSLIDRLESGLQKSSRECVSLVVWTKECLMTRII